MTSKAGPALISSPTDILACLTRESSCSRDSLSYPFTLVSGTAAVYCVPRVINLQSCAAYPLLSFASGLPLFDPSGSLLIGCTDAVTCPTPFPITFFDARSRAVRCLAAVLTSCSAASAGLYPNDVRTSNGLVGCRANTPACSPGQVVVSASVDEAINVQCLQPDTGNCTVPGAHG